MKQSLVELPEPKIETIVELLDTMVKEKWGTQLAVIHLEGGNFEGYQKAVKVVEGLPTDQRQSLVVSVCLDDADLLRYPFFDVEFNVKAGAKKIGVTGSLEKVAELMRLIGGQQMPRQ